MKKAYILFLMHSVVSIPLISSEPYTSSGQPSVWWQGTASMGVPGYTAGDEGYLASLLQMEQQTLRVGGQAYLALQELQQQRDQEKK